MTTSARRGDSPAALAPYRARLDRGTSRINLPAPPSGHADFSITGRWDDPEYGPGSTAVELICRTRVAKRNSTHRLAKDASFPLPEGTESIELRVIHAAPSTSLEATVTPIAPVPAHER